LKGKLAKVDVYLASGLAGLTGFFGSTFALYRYMTSLVFRRDFPVYAPAGKVSVVICAFNEEATVGNALASLRGQNVVLAFPDFFEFILVDSYSSDRTVEVAKPYVDVVVIAERGKLNARHVGVLNASGDIVVAVDADCVFPPNFLNLLLRHFKDRRVVAVGGPRLVAEFNLVGLGYVWKAFFDWVRRDRLPGSNSAFRRWAYFKSGGFNLAVNQFSRAELVREEEHEFARRLSRFGKIVFDLTASCFTSSRFWYCLARGSGYVCEGSPELCSYCASIMRGERF
jgi:glycosyltransferase involved in cell wall biosynthesis